jgi:putative membrane protein
MLSGVLVAIAVLVIQSVALLLLSGLLPGLQITSWTSALAASVCIGILNGVLWPAFIKLIQRVNLIVFVVLSILLNGACVFLAAALLPGMSVDSLWTAFLVTLGITAATICFTSLFAFHDADYYTRSIIKRMVADSPVTAESDEPGVIFLQIDGLSEPVLRSALRSGHVPTMAKWLESGSHRLVGWEANLPCQTSASQAGILHGSNVNIPAFRWLEKETGRVFVSNHPKDAQDIEARISNGSGLLAGGGAGMSNIFSGDAAESMLTFSRVLDASSRRSSAYSAYLSSPVNLAHTLVLMFWDIVLEMWARLVAWIGNVEPKGHRRFPYQLVRAFTTVFLRDVVVYTLIGDMFRGVRVAYADFVGYDEVAHHSGIQRPDAMAVLRRIDHQLARLERAAASAPRPYRFVLLSDHGQTQGATFRQRYHQTLGQVVTSLMEGQADTVQDVSDDGDTWGYLNAFLTETSHEGDSHTAGLARRASAGHVEDGVVQMGPSEPAQAESAVTCLASGNLGLVYFNTLPGRATYEEITRAYPAVIRGLVEHPGIGFVMVRSEGRGPLVFGKNGVVVLNEDHVEGDNPLRHLGLRATEHLRRLDGFNNVPDLLINSFYDPVADEAAAFEELIGGHGGLGGKQMLPFLMYPRELDLNGAAQIFGAEELHRVLRSWVPVAPPQPEQMVPAPSRTAVA